MPQSQIKFIAADMDGTLLDEHSQLNPEFFDIFEKLYDKGITFAAASGRQYYSLIDMFASVKDRMMFIAENGTMVMHLGQELYSCELDTPSAKEIIKSARQIDGTYVVLCGKQSAYIETEDQRALDEIKKYYHRCQYVSDLLAVDDEFIKVAILNFNGSEELIYPSFSAQFGESHQVVVSAKIWLDVMNKHASKGAAIKHLQNTLGFTFEETMSFGDYLNDLEMLKESYHSYAMANAHPKIKEVARFCAPSNVEAGVLTTIKEKVLKA
ncbi:Cof-type HAD-IIB family hydrolase [Vibrio breoganii]|uniref:Cof-type HAD-IIB family hydrolase n=1 Tax=Vibrio breoganii TaxID=553239 RepID=UPI000C8572B0|nr:Cof-type HAD-IIB family hydrolase [Vibrio breoganii]PMH12871.1 HAD family hydrolase [Vibrio breoganii]PML95161.1 HAD family hydrolase [Vibrio breoganii]PMM13524.1 HAD family hydrolase [Vibrio breoganii]PMM20059.1 HAD family hydrolase [Vibrio breoganii]PMN64982.1 HAD family hydrolase [Vibrio breoganii]